MFGKNHEKIHRLCRFSELRIYYRVKNNKNLKLQVYNMCFLLSKVIFQTSCILQDQIQELTFGNFSLNLGFWFGSKWMNSHSSPFYKQGFDVSKDMILNLNMDSNFAKNVKDYVFEK